MARRRDRGSDRAKRRQLIERLLAEREETRESYRVLSERSGIPAATFAWWQRKLREEKGRAVGIELVEVARPWPTGSSVALELVLPGGLMVRVPSGFDREALRQVLEVVRNRRC